MSAPGARRLVADLRVADRVHAAFTAEPGEVLAIIGPNGAGKSSLLHALAGLVDVEGSAVLGATDLLRTPVRERRVGLVFQGQLLFPHLTALHNVAFGRRARGEGRAAAEVVAGDWLERFGIAELADRKPRELSGGQAQRVAIARALATDPDVLLLDEPFTGLDVSVQMALRLELGRHLRDFPGIALLVTHDAIDALTLSDRVLVLDDGRVAQVGPPAEVAAEPRTRHVARLVGLNLVADGDDLIAFTPDAVTVSLARAGGLVPAALARADRDPRAARGRRTPAGARLARPARRPHPGRRHRARPGARHGGLAVGQGDGRQPLRSTRRDPGTQSLTCAP